MRRRRVRIAVVLVVLLLAAAIALLVWVRRAGPPEAARLLPDGEGVLYLNARLLRLATSTGQIALVEQEPRYEEFAQETGIRIERHLEEVAFTVHAPTPPPPAPPPRGGRARTEPTPEPPYPRFSEVFIGRFDSTRLTAYLKKLARSTERYSETDIFQIPYEERTVRVAVLGVDTVAASNAQAAQPMHAMVDRYGAAARPTAGPRLVRDFYADVPFGSIAWGILRVASPGEARPGVGLNAPEMLASVLGGSTVIASLRYTGRMNVRMEVVARDERHAQHIAETASAWLGIFRAIEVQTEMGGIDEDVKQAFESLEVERRGERVVLTATVPTGFVEKLLASQ